MPWIRFGLEPERPRDGSREKRLARSRDILDEDVTACQQGDRDQPERRLAADHGPADGLAEIGPKVARDPKLVGRAWPRAGSGWRVDVRGRLLDAAPLIMAPSASRRLSDRGFAATSRFDRTTR